MKKIVMWDLVTRVLHWSIALAFAGAFTLALLSEHSPRFNYHMLLGLMLPLLLFIRLVWMLVGTRHVKAASLLFGVKETMAYFRSVRSGSSMRYAGHNPGSGGVAIAMYLGLAALVASGIAMSLGIEAAEEVHEVIAYGVLGLVGAHLAGIAMYTFQHRENIGASMLHGRKAADSSDAIPSQRIWAGLVVLLLIGGWGGSLWRSYNPQTRTVQLPVIGVGLTLGESEEGEKAGGGEAEHDED